MKLLQSELGILIIGILAVIVGLLVGSSKIAMLISLVVAILALLKKETGMLFLLILIPIRPFLTAVNPGFKVIGDAIIILLVLRTIFDYRKNIKNLFSFHPIEWALFAFALVGIISALMTGVSLKAIIFQIRAYFLFYLVFYVAKRMEFSAGTIQKMTITTFIMGVILSLQGIVEKISNKTMLMPEAWTQWVLSPTNRIRVYGLLKGPNELSLYLLIAFIISLYLLKQVSGKMKYLIYVGLTLFGTTILLTYSRGTLLTLLVFLIVYLLVTRKWRPLIPLAVVAVVSVGLFWGVNRVADQYYNHFLVGPGHQNQTNLDAEGAKRYKDAFSNESIDQSSSSGRIYRVKKAVEIFKDHPIIGTGFATFGGAATLSYTSPIYKHYGIETNFYADNQYIMILVETGVLGMLAILMFAYFLLVKTWKNRNEYYGPLLVYFFCALIVGGTVYNILENDAFMMIYFILLGIVYQKHRHPLKG